MTKKMKNETAPILPDALQRLQNGQLATPLEVFGVHRVNEVTPEVWRLRAFLPSAETAAVKLSNNELLPLIRRDHSDIFEADLTTEQKALLPQHYTLHWQEKLTDQTVEVISPYTFRPEVGELDLHLFAEGHHWQVYEVMGAHLKTVEGVSGVQFTVWAPSAERVSVVGDFNGWHGLRHPMQTLGSSGVWSLFVPGLQKGDIYKFEIRSRDGSVFTKIDPYAQQMEKRPQTGCLITQSNHQWQDGGWMAQRAEWDWMRSPINIYEVHLGSWQRDENGEFLNYREIAHRLVEYVKWMNYTHIELMPISEHPLDASWGYQTTGYYAPTSRYGTPDDFRYFVDYCHRNGIGVFLDWVPAHFPKDSFALARFDGTALYEHEDSRKGEHKEWGTLIFNYGRHEVSNFLIANALYWLKEFHIDGLRVDAVAAMLYLDYDRPDGEWLPNEHGGRENLEAMRFLQSMNTEVHQQAPGAVTMAEESTSWPMVSRPTWMGGLGFSMKWNMGWMNDTLDYFEKDPIYRAYHHNQLTFSQMYAYSENFILPLSHDEVVHMKGSLVEKMPGDEWQKMANLRLLLAYQQLHPGKSLLFMGGEFAQWQEWSEARALDWYLCDLPQHRGVMQAVRAINELTLNEPALHQNDFNPEGFFWVDCHDYEHAVLSFVRQAQDKTGQWRQVVCLFNFTPVVREGYRIGLPKNERYIERFNSDSSLFGGSNLGNGGAVMAEHLPWMNQPHSAEVTLPPLGVVVLQAESELNRQESGRELNGKA